MFVLLRRSMQRVGGTHLRVIVPVGNTAPFVELLQQWLAVGNIVSDLSDYTALTNISATLGFINVL